MGRPELDPRIVLFLRKALLFHMGKMVHSGIIFWPESSCKRRRFLSDLSLPLFPSQSSQNPVRPVLLDSGGASLPPLTEWWPARSWPPPPPESGNIKRRLLASVRGSEWSFGARKACTTCAQRTLATVTWPAWCPGGPPYKL